MKYVVVVIRDICADLYGQPFYQASVGMAQRAFTDSVNAPAGPGQPTSLLNAHPEHFELYHLGHFDDQDGSFDLFPKPRQLLLGSNCVTKAS